ncbi:hypothetical protein BN1708_020695, partial [Verticillium longisporum]
DGVARRAAGGD